jgi:hypothetical protein
MDLPGATEHLQAFRFRFPEREVVAVSAKEDEGIGELRRVLDRWLRETDMAVNEVRDFNRKDPIRAVRADYS